MLETLPQNKRRAHEGVVGLNVLEIVSQCPTDYRFYSIFGNCYVNNIEDGHIWWVTESKIHFKTDRDGKLNSVEGSIFNKSTEPVVWPSHSQKDWGKFEFPVDLEQKYPVDTPVMCSNDGWKWIAALYLIGDSVSIPPEIIPIKFDLIVPVEEFDFKLLTKKNGKNHSKAI